jgi:hypothetical protein
MPKKILSPMVQHLQRKTLYNPILKSLYFDQQPSSERTEALCLEIGHNRFILSFSPSNEDRPIPSVGPQ